MDIYSILSSKTHNPHYLNKYITFIQKCQLKNTDYVGYMERHHICPKAKDMFPQYKSFKKYGWNLARLTARQHFVAHIILWKAFPNFYSCVEAAWLMKHQNNEEINSKLYEKLKLEKRKSVSERHKGKILKRPTKDKLREYRLGKSYEELYGKEKSEHIKAEMRKARKGKNSGNKNPMFGKTGELHHGYGISINGGAKNFMFGKEHSKEAKRKISEAKRKRDLAIEKTILLLSDNDKQSILDYYLKNKNMKETSIKFGLPQTKISIIIKNMGYYPSGKKIDEFRVK